MLGLVSFGLCFWDCGLGFRNLVFQRNNFDLGAVFLSCFVSFVQELPSPGLELRTSFPEV
jgi:hypothetical protein